MNYYNEWDKNAAEWLRELIRMGEIPDGFVDDRSITEVKPDELNQYTQCHFFAGVAGWSEALRIARISPNRPLWTGSAPCQPFSVAGNKKGKADVRHLFPVWLNLILVCKPPVIFGEQVESAIAHGWLDDVYQGLEAEGYACGTAVLPACGVGAPHRRNRLFFVADSGHYGLTATALGGSSPTSAGKQPEGSRGSGDAKGAGLPSFVSSDVANGSSIGREHRPDVSGGNAAANGAEGRQLRPADVGEDGVVADDGRVSEGRGETSNGAEGRRPCSEPSGCGTSVNMAHLREPGCEGSERSRSSGAEGRPDGHASERRGSWDGFEWHLCADGRSRPVERAIPCLDDGLQGLLVRGGNLAMRHLKPKKRGQSALKAMATPSSPELAAEFIMAWREATGV